MDMMIENFYASFNELKELYKLELIEQKADKIQIKELKQTFKYADKINLGSADSIKIEVDNEQRRIHERMALREQTISKYKKILRKFKDIDKFINENF